MAGLFSRFGQGHDIGIAVIFLIERIAQCWQDVFQIGLQPFQLGLRRAFFGLDIGQPAAQLVTGAARDGQTVGQRLHVFLPLFEKGFCAVYLFIGIGPRQIAGFHAHLGGHLQKFRFQMLKVGVIAQMLHPGAHGIKFAR